MTTPLFIILFLWQRSSFTMFHVYTEILATRNPTCSLLIPDSVGLHISFHSRSLPYSILSTRDLHQIKKKKNSIHLILGLVSSLTLSAHITILYYSIYCFSIHYTVCLLFRYDFLQYEDIFPLYLQDIINIVEHNMHSIKICWENWEFQDLQHEYWFNLTWSNAWMN